MALDERLRRELEGAARPADPSGVYEDLIRRYERRRAAKRLKTIALTLGVIAATVSGVVVLSHVFQSSRTSPGVNPTPVGSLRNGRIAYSLSSSEGLELHAILPDGSDDRLIPTPPGLPWLPAWSPDGSKLAVAIFPSGGGDRAIWVMNKDGSDAHRIASAYNVSVPSWSPDGSTIAYTATSDGRMKTEIHLVAPDGTGDRVVREENRNSTYEIFSAKFSPDGREIVFDRGTDSVFDIFVMRVDGSHVRRLTTTGTDYDPHWSPDGSRIAFTRQGDGAQSDIYVMNADGTDVQQLTDGGDGVTNLYPEWSPDGTAIAYVASVTGGPGALMVMNTDGSEVKTLVPEEVLGIAWQSLADDSIESSHSSTPIGSEDIGLGFPVCNVSSIDAHFATPDTKATVFVATRSGDTRRCPVPEDAFNVLALDADHDGLAESSYGPIECTFGCRTFSAPDLDGDGTAEVMVVQSGGAVVGMWLYDIESIDGDVAIVPVNVAEPGDPDGLLEPGQQASFLLGGDGFEVYTLRCGSWVEGVPALVVTLAESLPHDSPDAEWHAHEVWLVLRDDDLLHVVNTRDFTEPVTDDPSGPSFQSGERLCGSNLGP